MAGPPTTSTLRRAGTALLAIGAVVAVLAGCGEPSDSGDADPASLAPADAPAYAEVQLDPTGDQEAAVASIAERFGAGADLAGQITALLDEAFRSTGSPVSYSEDVEPWLGDRAAGFVSRIGEEDADGAVVIATTDAEAARQAAEEDLGDSEERSYEGVDYRVGTTNQIAAGIVEGFLVVGSDGGLRAAVDASSGESLLDSDRYQAAVEGLPSERLAALYVDTARIGELVAETEELSAPERQLLERFYGLGGSEPLLATLTAEPDALVLDSSAANVQSLVTGPVLSGGTPLLGELPADSWLAVGQPDVGETLDGVLDAVGSVPGLDRETVAQQLRIATGLDLDRDVLGWIGDIGLFVRGTREEDLGGGAVIESDDPAASRRALEALERVLRKDGDLRPRPSSIDGVNAGFSVRRLGPQPVEVAQRDSRVVIAYGRDAAAEALDPRETLEADGDFEAATGRLGEGYAPSTYLAVDSVLELAESFGAGDDPDFAAARPMLEQFANVVAGTSQEGETVLSRTRIQLR